MSPDSTWILNLFWVMVFLPRSDNKKAANSLFIGLMPQNSKASTNFGLSPP